VVPWKRRRGYATLALGAVLRDAKAEGLRYVEITTASENTASQRVIPANGGVLVEEFNTPAVWGAGGTFDIECNWINSPDRPRGGAIIGWQGKRVFQKTRVGTFRLR
jgi:predicted acetyltransferase